MIRAAGACACAVAFGAAACSTSSDPADAPGASPGQPEVAIDGDWTQILSSPDLGPLGTPDQEQVDFGVWQAGDGTWQLWECIRGASVGGYGRLFYRWEGAQLTDPSSWRPHGIALQADTSAGEPEGSLQAPFVLRALGKFHMFYGAWSHICHAESDDGKTFTRVLVNGSSEAFHEGDGLPVTNTRDPMVLPVDGAFRVYDSALPDHEHDADYSRTSVDLATWSDPVEVAAGDALGEGGPVSSECPFVVRPDGSAYYYLFRTQAYAPGHQETRVYRSRDPASFGVDDDAKYVRTLPVAAPEIVQSGGQYYILALLNDAAKGLHGVRVAKLRFAPPP